MVFFRGGGRSFVGKQMNFGTKKEARAVKPEPHFQWWSAMATRANGVARANAQITITGKSGRHFIWKISG